MIGVENKNAHRIATLLYIMTIPCVIAGITFLTIRASFVYNAEIASGTIVEMVPQSSDDGVTYSPVFSFTDKKGNTHTIRSPYSSYPPMGEVSDKVNVLYMEDNPKDAILDTWFQKWGGGSNTIDTGYYWVTVRVDYFLHL